nr:uncharacterized protein LOC128697755 [Cherax quadricarinatus]
MTEKPASAASFPEESRDPLSLWNTTNSWNTLDSSWNEENVSTTRWPFLIPSQNASAYIPAGWTEPIRDSGTDAEFNLDDVNIALNQSLKNVTGNETYYDYDYEAALETFFWRQLAPPLVVYGVTYVVGVVGNSLIIFTICRYRRLKTTTNVFLASLASADLLLILICIPVKVSVTHTLTQLSPCQGQCYPHPHAAFLWSTSISPYTASPRQGQYYPHPNAAFPWSRSASPTHPYIALPWSRSVLCTLHPQLSLVKVSIIHLYT